MIDRSSMSFNGRRGLEGPLTLSICVCVCMCMCVFYARACVCTSSPVRIGAQFLFLPPRVAPREIRVRRGLEVLSNGDALLSDQKQLSTPLTPRPPFERTPRSFCRLCMVALECCCEHQSSGARGPLRSRLSLPKASA